MARQASGVKAVRNSRYTRGNTTASIVPVNVSTGPDPSWTVTELRGRVKVSVALVKTTLLVFPVPVMVMGWLVPGAGPNKLLPVRVSVKVTGSAWAVKARVDRTRLPRAR